MKRRFFDGLPSFMELEEGWRGLFAEGEGDPPGGGDPPATPPADPPATPPADPPATPPADPPADPPPTVDWRAGITDTSHQEFARRFTSPADLAKTAFEFRQKLSTALVVPGEDATDEQKASFRKGLGVPDTADGYDYTMPEDTPEVMKVGAEENRKKFFELMHGLNAPQAVVHATLTHFHGLASGAIVAEDKALSTERQKQEDALKKEWGTDFDANKATSDKAIKAFGSEELAALVERVEIDGVKLGNHPAMLNAFANIGRKMGEDVLHSPMSPEALGDAEKQIGDLTKQAHEARLNGDRKESDRLFAQREVLSNQIYGTEQIGA